MPAKGKKTPQVPDKILQAATAAAPASQVLDQPMLRVPGRLATVADFCEYASITPAMAAQLRYLGDGPPFAYITGKQVRYSWESILNWVASNTYTRTTERPRRASASARKSPVGAQP
jgi:hypothetical protein